MIKKLLYLYSNKEWFFIFTLLAISTILLPLFNLLVPEESFFQASNDETAKEFKDIGLSKIKKKKDLDFFGKIEEFKDFLSETVLIFFIIS